MLWVFVLSLRSLCAPFALPLRSLCAPFALSLRSLCALFALSLRSNFNEASNWGPVNQKQANQGVQRSI